MQDVHVIKNKDTGNSRTILLDKFFLSNVQVTAS